MRLPKKPVPSRYNASRPCPMNGCPSMTTAIEYMHMKSVGPPIGVQFVCESGHRLERRVTHLWEILHEDRREAFKENFARTLEDAAAQATGDGRGALTMIAQRVRASTPETMPRLDRTDVLVEITGWPRERVDAMLGTLIPGVIRAQASEN